MFCYIYIYIYYQMFHQTSCFDSLWAQSLLLRREKHTTMSVYVMWVSTSIRSKRLCMFKSLRRADKNVTLESLNGLFCKTPMLTSSCGPTVLCSEWNSSNNYYISIESFIGFFLGWHWIQSVLIMTLNLIEHCVFFTLHIPQQWYPKS